MHLSEISVKKPVAMSMLFIGLVLLGLISLSRLSVDLLPDLAYPKLTVWTTYRNVGPQEVEEFITKPVEEVLATIPGIRRIQSVSREGISLVTTEFLWGTQMDFAMLNVREKLDQLRWRFPREAGRPTIIQLDPNSQPMMGLSVSGGSLVQIKALARNVIKRRLEQLKGVALAEVIGGPEREIQVDVNLSLLDAFGLSIGQVGAALHQANYNLPGGTIKQGHFRYALRTLGEFQEPAEIAKVVIVHMAQGLPISIRDVATVTDGLAERENITRYNGEESIGILLQKEAGSNTVEVTRRIKQVLAELRQEYPEISITVAYEQARFISSAILNLIQNTLIGGILAFVILFFFLRDVRQPVYIALSIPISIITTFVLLYFTRISLNIMSLGGLALAVGMLVDNSIVVLENIFRHREMGSDRLLSAIDGAQEVAMPVTAGTATTITVFLPVVYVYGVAGQLFREQALTVTFSLLASLLVALTLLPLLLAHLLVKKKPSQSESKTSTESKSSPEQVGFFRQLSRLIAKVGYWLFIWPLQEIFALFKWLLHFLAKLISPLLNFLFRQFDALYQTIFQKYEQLLEYALNKRVRILGLAAVVMGLALLLLPFLTRELMPRVDAGEFSVKLQLPPGYSLEATAENCHRLEQLLLGIPEVAGVFSTIGLLSEQTGGQTQEAALNQARLQVKLKYKRDLSTAEVMARLRTQAKLDAGAEMLFETGTNVLQQVLGTSAPPLAIKIQGEDLDVGLKLSQQIQAQLQEVPGLKDLTLDFDLGRPEIRLQIKREALGRFGVSVKQLAEFIKNRVQGNIATVFKDFDQKIDVRVRPTLAERDELEDVLNAHFQRDRLKIPLRTLISTEETLGPVEVQREDQVRQLVLYGHIEGAGFNTVIDEIEQRLSQLPLPEGFRVVIGGEQEEVQQSFHSLLLALILSVALIFMVLAAQFESLLHPFIILLDIPITACLTLVVLFLTGMSLNVMSFIGLIVLAGIAVNDSIVKVDFINQERRRGTALKAAIWLAGQKRFRPIVMTTLTTVLGLLPLAIGFGEGAELQRPLAITILGGLILSTFVSLILVPVLYAVLERKTAILDDH